VISNNPFFFLVMKKVIFLASLVGLNIAAFCQLSPSGKIEHSRGWEKKLYVIRIDRKG
jgi:hypothetical protein